MANHSASLLRLETAQAVLARSASASGAVDPVDPATLAQARDILQVVAAEGERGLRREAARLRDLASEDAPLVADKEELRAAFEAMPAEHQAVLVRTGERIRAFARAQRAALREVEHPIPGGVAGHHVLPVDVAGCYAPGGRYPLPSSVLMTAITAREAGVKTVVVASPRPLTVTLAAAHVAGADMLLRVGGAQAIGALAFGVAVPSCDVVVGPGNVWVTAAKQLVSGRCGIDMLAGPSECLVWADASSDPALVAADLLAQAEHDTEAVPVLVTHDGQAVVDAVQRELQRQLETLPTAQTARASVTGKGYAVVCASKEEAARVCDAVGPEHLEVMTRDAAEDAKRLSRYGGLFVGPRSAEVFGDYGAGPNHVLPTSGTARYTGGLSVFTFLKIVTWMRIDDELASQQLISDAATLARLEGLEGHARAAEQRKRGGAGGSPTKRGRPGA